MIFSLLKKRALRSAFLRPSQIADLTDDSLDFANEECQGTSSFENTGEAFDQPSVQENRVPGDLSNHPQQTRPQSRAYKPKKNRPSPSMPERRSLPWNDITQMLGHESTTALSNSIREITKICEHTPSVASQLAPVLEQLEQAHRTALITLQFVRSRTVAEYETGYVSLRQVVMEVLDNRAKWLEQRNIKVSVGPLDEKLVANITALFLLVDELVSWAGKLAPEIIIAITPSKMHRSGIQLLVFAKFEHGQAIDAEWTNVGWYLWHKLATAVGGSAELNVMDQALCVSVTFTPVAPKTSHPEPGLPLESEASTHQAPEPFEHKPPQTAAHAESDIRPDTKSTSKTGSNLFSGYETGQGPSVHELSHDRDIAAIVSGCHVQIIISDVKLKRQTMQAMASLGLCVTQASSVQEALQQAARTQIPHAVIYQSGINISDMLQLRFEWAQTRATAYIELTDREFDATTRAENPDFHFSSVGTLSTAHVTTQAIADSLAPALVFELCKVL